MLIPRPFGVVDSIRGDLTFGLELRRRFPRLPNAGTADWAGAVEGLARPRGVILGVDPKSGDWRGEAREGGDLRVKVTEVAGDHCAAKFIGYLNDGAASASAGMDRLSSEGTEEGM